MTFTDRLLRHIRVTREGCRRRPRPPFLILFVNSACNMRCEHCFYWRSLNQRDDLTFAEVQTLSQSLGRIENLYLSGGEPFLRAELGAICRQFARRNRVQQIYVPTNGYFTDKTVRQVEIALEESSLQLLVVELSLDGMAEYHDAFRRCPGAFERAIQTYDALAAMQEREPRLRIHAVSTANTENLREIQRLTAYLYERCPRMDHHNLAMIRGDRARPTLEGPDLRAYQTLYTEVRRLWGQREAGRQGASVEPMLQWAKLRTAEAAEQVIPCRAGRLVGVVYANGDVSVCESRPPLGNLRQHAFSELWDSASAQQVRRSIRAGECYCTGEMFLWPSILYQPLHLLRAAIGGRARRSVHAKRAEGRGFDSGTILD